MNVRKRGLALLMCICMIFTLLPFSALADATAKDGDIVYGTYSGTTWTQQEGLTAENVPYTNNTTGADVKYSKTATPVDGEDDAYNVTLKIESTTKETAPDASAVVLVIDTSGSMGDYQRLAKAKEVAKKFVNDYGTSGKDRYIAIVEFASDAYMLNFGGLGILKPKVYWLDASNANNRNDINKAIANMDAGGGTNLEQGLSVANSLLSYSKVSKIAKSNKFVIALTDGKPTYWGSGDSWGGDGFKCDETTYNKTIAAAKTLKNNAEYLYTVCYGAQYDVIDWNQETVGDFLEKRIASTGKAYNATDSATDSGDSLSKAFAKIYESIKQGISSGFTVTDPMGKYVTLQDKSLTDSTISNGTITWKPKNGTTVENSDGSKTTTYTLTYKVTLGEVPEDDTYPLNKDTTLEFKDGETAKTLHFNVPGVYREAPKYTVTYKYIGDVPVGAQLPSDNTQYKKGDTVTVKPAPTLDGYTFSGWTPTTENVTINNGKFEMPANNVVLEGSWTKLEGYTVKYMWGDKVLDTKAGAALAVGMNTPNESPKSIEGYTPKSNDPIRITISTNPNENVIIFEYYKNVTLTANSKTVTYNGEEQTVSGFTGAPEGADFSAITVGAQGTNAGTYPANFAVGTANTVDKTGKYIVVETTNGSLEIARANVTVTAKSYEIAVGSELPKPEADVSGLFGTDTVEYTISGMPENSDASGTHTLTPSGDSVQGNYNVNYKPGTLTIYDTYTVTYKYEYTDGTPVPETDLAAPVDSNSPYRAGSRVTVLNAPTDTMDGYIFDGWYIGTIKMDGKPFEIKSDTVIIGKWKPVTGLTCTINYIWNGNKTTPIRTVTIDGLTYNEVVKKFPMDIPGYTPVSNDSKEIVVNTTGNVINFYYYKNVTLESNSGTFTYDGKDHSVSGYDVITKADNGKDVKVDAEFSGVSASRTEKDIGSYPVTFNIRGDVVDKEALIGETDSNSYYIVSDVEEGILTIEKIKDEVTVKITGNTKTVTYNGKEQNVEGYVADTNGLPITVSLATGKTAFANGTEVGTYKMNLAATDFVATSDIYGNIKIVIVEDGWLKINRRPMPPVNPGIGDEITVEITGNSDSVVYDGTEHSVKDYTVKISDPRYTEADFTFTGKAEASGINAGTYEMGLKAEQFKNTNALFRNVKFVIKADGVLTITPKELIITAGSKTEYGPTPVTCDEWTVSGLAAGDKVESVKITGIQSVPGSSPNVPSDAVIKNAKGEDVTKNYAIKYVNGTLTMLEVLNKEDHFNYIIGTPEGLSLPTANVTRAEVATIFFRLMTDDARAKFDSLDNNFSDVAKGQWYNRAISTLANAGIIKGDPAGTYRPGDAITRAEMAAIIARFGDFKEGGKTFNDISGHWAQKYIELAASNGWINGNPDGTFKPNNNITRAETVAMINRVLDRQTKDVSDLLPVSQMTNWSDNANTAAWYYRDMQEATNNHKAERVGESIYEKWTEKLPDIDWASYQI